MSSRTSTWPRSAGVDALRRREGLHEDLREYLHDLATNGAAHQCLCEDLRRHGYDHDEDPVLARGRNVASQRGDEASNIFTKICMEGVDGGQFLCDLDALTC